MTTDASKLLWANFFEFSYNNYTENQPDWFNFLDNDELEYQPYLRWDQQLWEELTKQIAAAGGNAILLHLGDGIKYDSHPEIAVEGAWTPGELKAEIKRLKALGIELYPMLNFSSAHDLWLGKYHRMVSTPEYYAVCEDLIAEVAEIFDHPAYFSLGYDEETFRHQSWYEYAVVRQADLWWRDFLWFVEQVEHQGSRPWIWSDKIWEHNDEFLARMPRSVVQSNWHYYDDFDLDADRVHAQANGIELREPSPEIERQKTTRLRAFLELERGGFDQVPAGGFNVFPDNFAGNVRFAQQHLPRAHVLGFMQTHWAPMLAKRRDFHELGVEKFADGVRAYDPTAWALERSPASPG
jgi:hypothetical protein